MKTLMVALLAVACLGAGWVPDADAQGRNSVRGVISKGGRPVPSAWVTISQAGKEKGRSLTGDDGKYYIGNLADGVYDIVVIKDKKQVFKGQFALPKNAIFDIKV
jgi:hypothetical protein